MRARKESACIMRAKKRKEKNKIKIFIQTLNSSNAETSPL